MRWYEGDIAQAVTMSKSKNAIFVVYVEGKDEKSTNLTSFINDNNVSSKLESDSFVAIKVEAGSISHNQFAAIYKSVSVPSLFFIGKSGKPIDIIVESSSVKDLSTRINTIIGIHNGISQTQDIQATSSSVSSTVPNVTVPSTPDTIKSTNPSEEFIKLEKEDSSVSASVVEENVKASNIMCENGVCYKVSDTDISSNKQELPSSSNTETKEVVDDKKEISKEEKIERAKELVEVTREAKKKEEEEAERLKEIERRKAGQDVQKLRRWQQDQELKNLLEERQRAKNEEKAARDRILAQIAQDKADRAVRFGTSPPAVSHQPDLLHRPSLGLSANQNVARLQFKLPDGSSRTQNFDSVDTLQDVTNFVSQNMSLPFKNFSLSTTFPRREFTSNDLERTLRDLELCPNAVILILPAHSATSAVVSPQEGGFMSIIWFLLSPIIGFFGYFRTLIFGQSEDDTPRPTETNKRNNEDASGQPQQPTKRRATETTVVRRQGGSNIHRLSDRTDSDDDNNTWNGNSTQQM